MGNSLPREIYLVVESYGIIGEKRIGVGFFDKNRADTYAKERSNLIGMSEGSCYIKKITMMDADEDLIK